MIRVEKTHLPVAALTHPGMKGKNNEDRFGVTAFRLKASKKGPVTPVLLAVLSDGIGGNRAGEVASELAVNLISQYVAGSDGRRPQQILDNAIQYASGNIYKQAQENLEQAGMGATCACVWIAGDRMVMATVGDSRVYLMRKGVIQQLSTDHTWIQEALDHGIIQPEEVSGHPNAHVIRRYLGSPTPPEVDFHIRADLAESQTQPANGQGLQLLPGDCVLLCSDGLTDLVSDEEILAAFNTATLEEAGQQLIGLANQRGGHDNITIVAIQYPEASQGALAAGQGLPARSRALFAGCAGIIALAVLAGSLAGGWLLYSGKFQPTQTPTITQTAPLTPTPTKTRTPTATPGAATPFFPLNGTATPFVPVPGSSPTPTIEIIQGLLPTITPWPTNTPGLPVVTRLP